MNNDKVVIIIPALNEEKTIGAVIKGAKVTAPVLVVSDGSTDLTSTVALEAGAQVLELPNNVGVDRALAAGFREASRLGYTIVATIDADGQHDTTILNKVIDPVLNGNFVMCHSCRDDYCRITERLLRSYSSLMHGLGDILCGLKAFRIDEVFKAHESLVSRPTLGTALPWAVVDDGKTIAEIMITVTARESDDIPRIGGIIKANYRVMKALIRLVWWDMRSFIHNPAKFIKLRFHDREKLRIKIQ